jgi:hypothetical protein
MRKPGNQEPSERIPGFLDSLWSCFFGCGLAALRLLRFIAATQLRFLGRVFKIVLAAGSCGARVVSTRSAGQDQHGSVFFKAIKLGDALRFGTNRAPAVKSQFQHFSFSAFQLLRLSR